MLPRWDEEPTARKDKRPLDDGGSGGTQKLSRVASGVSSTADVCQGQDQPDRISPDRQCDGNDVHQQEKRNAFPEFDPASQEGVELVHGEGHIPRSGTYSREENTIADAESRAFKDWWDWMLNPELFRRIQLRFGPLEIDLFASRASTQLPRFFSWRSARPRS